MTPLVLSPSLLNDVQLRAIALPEYSGPYQILELMADSPLAERLQQEPLLYVPVPSCWREQRAPFRHLRTTVTSPSHSQTPHIDHPHERSDPRRYNLFWAERPRMRAQTYFLSLDHAHRVTAFLEDVLCGNAEVWAACAARVALWRSAPARVSRYPLPSAAVDGFEALVRDGDSTWWSRLSDFGKTTLCTRLLGNLGGATDLTSALLRALRDDVYVETWASPCIVIADDTLLLHGRLGSGESGDGFFRIWLSGPPAPSPFSLFLPSSSPGYIP